MAQHMRPLAQAMAHRDAPIENKAIALPAAVFLGHFLEIFQNAAFQVEHIAYALRQQKIGRFLAADTAGAKHGDAFVVKAVFVVFPPLGKLAERFGFRVYRALECADGHLVIVAGVDQHNIGAANKIVPVLRGNIVPNLRFRVYIGLAHCDDLALKLYLAAGKGLLAGGAFFPFQIGATGQGTHMCQHRVDPGAAAGDCAVDPLLCQQQSACHLLVLHQRQQRPAQSGGGVKAGKVIEGSNDKHGGALRLSGQAIKPRQ